MYCQGVEELLKNINSKKETRKNNKIFEDAPHDFIDHLEDSHSM
jgi:hypothetical protein